MARVEALGYLVATVKDLPAWKKFAVDVHGMQIVEQTRDRLLLRLDARAWRLDLRAGSEESIDAVGWEVPGPEDLAEFEQVLNANGVPARRASTEQARQRKVSDLVLLEDPDGRTHELFYGAANDERVFISPTGAQFITGHLGLGHVMFAVSDSGAFRRLFMDLLGFRLSDYIDIGPDPGTFLHCNPRHHSLAFAEREGVSPRLGHLMVQVSTIDTVGRAYDKILAGAAKVGATLGRHTNDEMISYYVKSPSGWEFEYGIGGLEIDDETWTPVRWEAAHYWGHTRGDGAFERVMPPVRIEERMA